MNKVFDKLKPVFEAIAANKYISAIRDGFIACMPIIIFSSIFMMVAYVPNAWGFYWPDNVTNTLMVAYNYSMGLLALVLVIFDVLLYAPFVIMNQRNERQMASAA